MIWKLQKLYYLYTKLKTMKKKTTTKAKSPAKMEGSSTADMYKKMKFGGETGTPSKRVDGVRAYDAQLGKKKGMNK